MPRTQLGNEAFWKGRITLLSAGNISKEGVASLDNADLVSNNVSRFLKSYLIAWLLNAGWVSGVLLHQRVFYGNFNQDICSRILETSPLVIGIEALVGVFVAIIIDFGSAALLPRALEPRNLVRTTAAAFGLAVVLSFACGRADISIDRGCF